MRRLARYILNALNVLSLLLCVATMGLWVRSHYRSNSFNVTYSPNWEFAVQISMGEVRARIVENQYGTRAVCLLTYIYFQPAGVPSELDELDQVLGQVPSFSSYHKFGFRRMGVTFMGRSINEIDVPFWFFTLSFSVLPVMRLRKIGKNRTNSRAGLCPICSYDLRATPDRCPECGSIPEKAKA